MSDFRPRQRNRERQLLTLLTSTLFELTKSSCKPSIWFLSAAASRSVAAAYMLSSAMASFDKDPERDKLLLPEPLSRSDRRRSEASVVADQHPQHA